MNWAWNQYGGFWGKDKEFKAAFTKKQAEINKSTKK